jgi:hypothetical protein
MLAGVSFPKIMAVTLAGVALAVLIGFAISPPRRAEKEKTFSQEAPYPQTQIPPPLARPGTKSPSPYPTAETLSSIEPPPPVDTPAPPPTYTADVYNIQRRLLEEASRRFSLAPAPPTLAPAPPNYSPSHPVSEAEVFNEMNPPSYIDLLSYYQDQLIGIEFIAPSERLTFDSEENIRVFLVKGLEYLAEVGAVEPEDYQRLKSFLSSDYTVWRQKEAEAVRRRLEGRPQGGASPLTPFSSYAGFGPYPHPILSNPLTKKLGFWGALKVTLSFLGVRNTSAQIPVPDCYKDYNPFFFVRGFNAWAGCCNCCVGAGKACVGAGCLNGVCAGWPNAIWDPVTGICGCG